MTLGKTLDQIQSSKQHKESFLELLLDSIKYMGENNISDLIPSLAWMDLQVSIFIANVFLEVLW